MGRLRRWDGRELRRHRRRVHAEERHAEPSGKRSFRAALTALSVSVLSILLAAVAIVLSVARPPGNAPDRPVSPAPATVTVTLLAPTSGP